MALIFPRAPSFGPRLLLLQLLFPILSGLLLALSLPPIGHDLLLWICLIPLAVLMRLPAVTLEAYIGMYLGGLVFQLVHLDWVRTSYGGTWFSGDHATDWLLQGVVAACWWPPLLAVGRAFYRRVGVPMFVLLPLVWVSFEYLRRELFVYFVDETGNPWGHLGYAAIAHLPLAQLADIGGVYLIAAVVALVDGALVDAAACSFRSPRLALVPISCALTVLVAAEVYGRFRMAYVYPAHGPSVALMPKWTERLPPFADPTVKPDLLLWSEMDSDQTIWDVSPAARAASFADLPKSVQRHWRTATERRQYSVEFILAQQAKDSNATLVAGCLRFVLTIEKAQKFNSLAFANAGAGFVGCYDKNCLVPWVEFSPRTPLRYLLRGSQGYSHGQSRPLFEVSCRSGTARCGASICFETAFPEHYRAYMQSGAGPPDLFVHAGSEGQDPYLRLSKALFTMAQLRAIECRRPIVRNVAGGYSALIDSCGRVTSAGDAGSLGMPQFVGPVPWDRRSSMYVAFGDWLPKVSIGVLLLPFVVEAVRRLTASFHARAPVATLEEAAV